MLCRLKGIVWIAAAASLTVHSAENQRPDGIEFYIRRHVEVLSGVLVNLRIEKKKFKVSVWFIRSEEKVHINIKGKKINQKRRNRLHNGTPLVL